VKRTLPGAFTSVATILLLSLSANPAAAAELRDPQVPLDGASLQAFLDGAGESIDVATDQMDVQNWATTVSGNSTFTVMIELSASAGANTIGIYNGDLAVPNPPRFPVFPDYAELGWHALAHFADGGLTVTLFHADGTYQGQTMYAGVDATRFGFYLEGTEGTFFTQDVRNGFRAQALAYQGSGVNLGQWWMCWEDSAYDTGDRDFDDCVIFLESVSPVSVDAETWAGIKTLFR